MINETNIAYLVNINDKTKDVIKGFYNKSLFIISSHTQNIVHAWRASGLFDERMKPQGIVIAVDPSSNSIETIAKSINKICEKYSVNAIASGEFENSFLTENDYFELPVYNGNLTRFLYSFNKALFDKQIDENTDILIIFSEKTDEGLLKYIANTMKYITLYSPSIKASARAEKLLYAYNATAVVSTRCISVIRDIPCAAVLDDVVYRPLKNILKAQHVISFQNNDMPDLIMYTDKLGTLKLRASFSEALLCLKTAKAPNDSISEISVNINSGFCS